jgi:ribosome-binding protein aMBF1 (putative translation factor)
MNESTCGLYKLLEDIGKTLHEARIQRKEKIINVSSSLRISQAVISRVENGRYKTLNLDLISRLAKYYGIQLNILVQ